MLRSWIAEAELAELTAWVTVQGQGRDPQQFWISVADALRGTSAGSKLVNPLTAAPDLDGWTVVEQLLADLGGLEERIWPRSCWITSRWAARFLARARNTSPVGRIGFAMSVKVTPNGTIGRKFPSINAAYRTAIALNTAVFRLLGGRGMGKLGILTTVGAKTGQKRSLPLAVFDAGKDTWWVVASKGGAPEHPAWYRNLAKHPDKVELEVAGRRLKVTPESLQGKERDAAWKTIVELSPNFGDYEKGTDREIPVVRLTPAS